MSTGIAIDYPQAAQAMRPAWMELGLREAKDHGTSISWRIGIGANCCWLIVRLDAMDMYEFDIVRIRTNETLAVGRSLFADTLAREVVSTWIDVCRGQQW